MPRVSSAPEDAFHFKGSYQDGWGVVTDAKAVVFQYPPAKEAKNNRPAGHQDPPQLCAELTIQRYLDGDGNKAATAPEQVLLSIQKPGRDTGTLDVVHPGNYADGNVETDPTDAGDGLGAEGNTLFAIQDGYAINDKTKWMTFTSSLQEKGFKPAILKRTYFPDLIGLYAYFTTIVKPKQQGDDFDSSVFAVKDVRHWPWEPGGPLAAGAAKGKPGTAAAAAAPKGRAKAPGAAAADAADAGQGVDAEIIAAGIAASVSAAAAGNSYSDAKKLRMACLMGINSRKPPVQAGLKKAVMDTMTEDFCTVQAMMAGAEVKDDGKIVFPAAPAA